MFGQWLVCSSVPEFRVCRVLRREFWPLQFLSDSVSRWFQKPLKVEHVWNVKVLLERPWTVWEVSPLGHRFGFRFLHSCFYFCARLTGGLPTSLRPSANESVQDAHPQNECSLPPNSHFQNLRISTMRTLELPAQHHVLSAPRAQYLAVGDCNLLTPGGGPRTTGIPQVPELTIGKHLSWYSFKESWSGGHWAAASVNAQLWCHPKDAINSVDPDFYPEDCTQEARHQIRTKKNSYWATTIRNVRNNLLCASFWVYVWV